jgi:regulator of protease activity HflC (stomatin/prohibitin superfamily)
MRSAENEKEEIDITKTLLFIFLTLIITLVIASQMIIPNIQKLKVAKIYTTRSLTMLKDTRGYHEQVSQENKQLQEKNRKTIEALATPLKENRLFNFSEEKFGNFEIDNKRVVPYDENFIRHELNVSARINTPELFYQYVDAMNSYESLVAVDFPITIESKKDFSLNLRYHLNIYELSSK